MQKSYFEALGIRLNNDETNADKWREAYDKAHDIRKFEIEMYWRRSAYLWTLQGAALAGLALILSTIKVTDTCLGLVFEKTESCQREWVAIVVIVGIWCFGTFTAFIWLLLLRGAKFWQNNWERHVDFLEDQISGALYKTYPVARFEAPYSVSKLNELMAGFTLLMWTSIGAITVAIVFGPNSLLTIVLPGFSALIFLAYYFDSDLRMTNFGEPMTKYPTKDTDDHMIIIRRAPPRTKEKGSQNGETGA
ncbi:hypothetical protein KPG71_00290 [Roseovarius sp. PS-C2]|uniref:RipA family octameric membrane protein n=1 Tax=Roseovarius sp. PS-C2 TaxID=2820814 RepID=UPI001C0BA687|nr:hypothetical protein [Roseovarius sp. PS-C2]MBU3258441.1 hypothetical protein [Roseovarius sp. PS-C2]